MASSLKQLHHFLRTRLLGAFGHRVTFALTFETCYVMVLPIVHLLPFMLRSSLPGTFATVTLASSGKSLNLSNSFGFADKSLDKLSPVALKSGVPHVDLFNHQGSQFRRL